MVKVNPLLPVPELHPNQGPTDLLFLKNDGAVYPYVGPQKWEGDLVSKSFESFRKQTQQILYKIDMS